MKKLFLIVLMAMFVGCNPADNEPATSISNPMSSTSEQSDIFRSPNANEHHRLMREFAQNLNWDQLVDMTMAKVPEEEIVQEMLGDDYDLYVETNNAIGLVVNQAPSRYTVELCDMMENGATTKQLMTYMDNKRCRNEFNETLVSSYIVFTQESNNDDISIPLREIDWAGVGIIDGWGIVVAGAPGGVAISAGVVVGSIIKEVRRQYN